MQIETLREAAARKGARQEANSPKSHGIEFTAGHLNSFC
jgi:hypothetical protein